MADVFANGRTVVHKGDGLTNVSSTPDVCKTPSPGGPIPVPYVNVAQDSDLASGATSVQIDGHAVAKQDSNLATSTGDEPGSAGGGIISGKQKGKVTWGSFSIDVKVEGKGVVRFLDVTQHNGNTFNSAWAQNGNTGLAYGDDPVGTSTTCPRCGKDKSEHRIHQSEDALGHAQRLLDELEEVRTKRPNLKVLKGPAWKVGGYMIGVLVCKCGRRIYAAMSGESYLEGFKEAVKRLNRERSSTAWVVSRPLGSSSPLLNPNGETFSLSDLPEVTGGNKPLVCAAPQLIQRALADGHQPGSMSEMYYSPKDPTKAVKVTYITYVKVHDDVLKTDTDQPQSTDGQFTHGQAVPSCKTCQSHTTQMLCGLKDKKCR